MIRLVLIGLLLFNTLLTNEAIYTPEVVINHELIDETDLINSINFDIQKGRNNPGNLRSIKTGKFRTFSTLKDGYDALVYDLQCKIDGSSRHTDSSTTVKQFIYIYAPPFENNSKRYCKIVCDQLEIVDTTKLHTLNPHKLAKAIIRDEDHKLYELMYNSKSNENSKNYISGTSFN